MDLWGPVNYINNHPVDKGDSSPLQDAIPNCRP